ncbi:hypothetical protein NLX83_38600 [Allokutzneria sp. A3M-2-11 16]|uniref:hypothetical protein n=1 Tax=Allokutzneria sp. A3M-2-11 16 TaxID=2962043 RepID=UPI0020B779E1|nr:hypothetical protein [Allokutzneria sp. A3M-2-11 16]MCP3805191.1 hypothetical protein [Allokutzneria sp. A3M-2-11 16]
MRSAALTSLALAATVVLAPAATAAAPTSLTTSASLARDASQPLWQAAVTLTGTLTGVGTGAKITFTTKWDNGPLCEAVTDARGVARCTAGITSEVTLVRIQFSGENGYLATFAGSAGHPAAQTPGSAKWATR